MSLSHKSMADSQAEKNSQPVTAPCRQSYEYVLSVLNESHNRRIKPGLSRIRTLLTAVGNPHHDFPAIHIAGTNGKGSVAAMLSAMLAAGGLKTGLYTSPHLEDYRERICLNSKPIPCDQLMALFEALSAPVDDMPYDDRPTPYELSTAIAFAWFSRQKVDVAVVETGMGGRWDATNALENVLVSVITNVSYDHCHYLGSDLTSIAAEKAGIIKKGAPVLTGASEPAYTIITSAAKAAGSRVYACGREITWECVSADDGAVFMNISLGGNLIPGLPKSLRGHHQEMNMALAAAAANLLPARYRPDTTTMRTGLSMVEWPGRLEIFTGTPSFLLDGAHNPDGMKALCNYLDTLTGRYPHLAAVIGILADKDASAMLARLSQSVSNPYFVSPASDRALSAEKMAALWPRSGEATACKDLPEAIRLATSTVGDNGLICIAGSLYLIGQARTLLKGGKRCL